MGLSALLVNDARLTKAPVNPLDVCTLVSVFPKEIKEVKVAIFPGKLFIPAVKNPKENFELVHIYPASWWKEMEEKMPWLEIVTSSMVMAESWINDYSAQLGVEKGVKGPGLFYIPGKFNKTSILTYKNDNVTFDILLNNARTKQELFFRELVHLADVMWARTNGNPISISDDARMAAEYLGVSKHKAWMQDFKSFELTNCKACGHMINPLFPVCANCKAIVNEDRAKELGIKFSL